MSKPRSYTNEFIEGAIKLALSFVSVARAAKDLGIPVATLHPWLNKAKNSGKVPMTMAEVVVNSINVSATAINISKGNYYLLAYLPIQFHVAFALAF